MNLKTCLLSFALFSFSLPLMTCNSLDEAQKIVVTIESATSDEAKIFADTAKEMLALMVRISNLKQKLNEQQSFSSRSADRIEEQLYGDILIASVRLADTCISLAKKSNLFTESLRRERNAALIKECTMLTQFMTRTALPASLINIRRAAL